MPKEPLGSEKLQIEVRRDPPQVHLTFSRQCNELPDVTDADVNGAFLSGATYESLVHKLGRKGPQTTTELLDIMTSVTPNFKDKTRYTLYVSP